MRHSACAGLPEMEHTLILRSPGTNIKDEAWLAPCLRMAIKVKQSNCSANAKLFLPLRKISLLGLFKEDSVEWIPSRVLDSSLRANRCEVFAVLSHNSSWCELMTLQQNVNQETNIHRQSHCDARRHMTFWWSNLMWEHISEFLAEWADRTDRLNILYMILHKQCISQMKFW